MRTEHVPSNRRVLFLFAHQDDEFGVYQAILDEIQSGSAVFCAYLTNGVTTSATALRRNQESLAVLTRLGVPGDGIFFPGTDLDIPDGDLPHHLETAARWIETWIGLQEAVQSIYVPAWEGGHHDHDALHAIAVALLSDNNTTELRQFSLYNRSGRFGPLFNVLHPLPENGTPQKRHIPARNRLLFLRCCLRYSSQAKTWAGLFPMVLLHYLLRGCQETQPVIPHRIRQRPHAGALYYEWRGFFSWGEMQHCLSSWERLQ
jgi:LmbE family N-acetylglucosaminyl deacetylase